MSKLNIRYLSLTALVLLLSGLILPSMSVLPHAGKFNVIIKIFSPSYLKSEDFSILSGIIRMYQENSVSLAFLLFGFSVLFPLWKLSLFIYFTFSKKLYPGKVLNFAILLGKFSMLDVFVIAVFIVAFKGIPGDSKIVLQPGIFFFTASVLLSMFISLQISKYTQMKILNDQPEKDLNLSKN